MRNIKIIIEYDGANYAGWQRQANKRNTIQEIIEKSLQKILQEKVRLVASGRTDAGVSALAQVANFRTNSGVSLKKLQRALNSLLPDDIVIIKAEEVRPDFHSRFNAKSKVYRYMILNGPYPLALLKDKVFFCHHPLNIKLMRKEAERLLGKHDFKAFCASGSCAKNTVRTIRRIIIKKVPTCYLLLTTYYLKDTSLITIDIEADGFLYNMVRNIVGTLLEIGKGKFPPRSLKRILQSKNRSLAGATVPAKGLYLLEVKY